MKNISRLAALAIIIRILFPKPCPIKCLSAIQNLNVIYTSYIESFYECIYLRYGNKWCGINDDIGQCLGFTFESDPLR